MADGLSRILSCAQSEQFNVLWRPDDHFSRASVAWRTQATYPEVVTDRANPPSTDHTERRRFPLRSAQPIDAPSLFGLAPDGVCQAKPVTRLAGELLPHRFTLTPAETIGHFGRGGLFSVALSLSKPPEASLDGGRYPPSYPVESGLSSTARPSIQAVHPLV